MIDGYEIHMLRPTGIGLRNRPSLHPALIRCLDIITKKKESYSSKVLGNTWVTPKHIQELLDSHDIDNYLIAEQMLLK